jgi:hypothetical protein
VVWFSGGDVFVGEEVDCVSEREVVGKVVLSLDDGGVEVSDVISDVEVVEGGSDVEEGSVVVEGESEPVMTICSDKSWPIPSKVVATVVAQSEDPQPHCI